MEIKIQRLESNFETIIKGDSKSLSIAAASIVAKITRDRVMSRLDKEFPGYNWSQNAGYPTKMHKSAILDIGIPHIIGVPSNLYTISCINKIFKW